MYRIDHLPILYTALFCEENIWKLIETLYKNTRIIPIDVLFILNQYNSIALFNQKNSKVNMPVIWDYHVILVAKDRGEFIVYDFDSQAEFPTLIDKYFQLTFPPSQSLNNPYQPLIKSINADTYFQQFYSDRQHMINIIDEKLFPKYPIIKPKDALEKLTLTQCRVLSNETLLPAEYLKFYDDLS